MSNDKGPIPLFAIIVSILMALVGLFFAFNFFTSPAVVLPDVDTTQPAIQKLAFVLGTRSFSMALALLIALLLKSRLGLIAVLSMRAVTEALDLVSSLGGPNATGAVIVIGIMILMEVVAIALLWRSVRADRA